jgi:hypothetical protein
LISEAGGCDCATENPIYPYGENGEGGPGIAYTCICTSTSSPVSPKKKVKGKPEPVLEPGQSIYRSGARLFTGNVKPPNKETQYELSSYCEHKIPPRKPSLPIWDPMDNMVPCNFCEERAPKTPGNCRCPREDALIFTMQAKKQVNGEDDWSPVVDGDVLEKRGHCFNCDKLTRKGDRYRGIGEEFKPGTETFDRLMGAQDKADDEAELHKQWNRVAWKEVDEEAEQWNRAAYEEEDAVLHGPWNSASDDGGGKRKKGEKRSNEAAELHKQWNRVGNSSCGKRKRGEDLGNESSSPRKLRPTSAKKGAKKEVCPACSHQIGTCECDVAEVCKRNNWGRGCKCSEEGGCGRNIKKCACKGKAGGCECTKEAGFAVARNRIEIVFVKRVRALDMTRRARARGRK